MIILNIILHYSIIIIDFRFISIIIIIISLAKVKHIDVCLIICIFIVDTDQWQNYLLNWTPLRLQNSIITNPKRIVRKKIIIVLIKANGQRSIIGNTPWLKTLRCFSGFRVYIFFPMISNIRVTVQETKQRIYSTKRIKKQL